MLCSSVTLPRWLRRMGIGRSRHLPVSYEEACQRVDKDVLSRLEETFRRTSSNAGLLPQMTFTRDIMGDGVPPKLAEAIYRGLGGNQKGIGYKELVCGLVLLVHGTREERAKLLALMLSQDGEVVTKEALQDLIAACDITPSRVNTDMLFVQEPYCSVQHFTSWVLLHPQLASFTRWLLEEPSIGFRLQGDPDPPTFYQILADKHGITDRDVMDIEKTYWGLKGSGKFDLETFEQYVCPPVPKELCQRLFTVCDVNCDGHIDLSEMVSLVAVCCRKTDNERHKLCFQVFDEDGDGMLNRSEFTRAVGLLLQLRRENTLPVERDGCPGAGGEEEKQAGAEGATQQDGGQDTALGLQSIVESALSQQGLVECLTEGEYLEWARGNDLSLEFTNVLFEICHVRFGLRPKNRRDEAKVIGGYLLRFHLAGRKPGDLVYLIAAEWFTAWMEYAGYEPISNRQGSALPRRPKKRRKGRSKSFQPASTQSMSQSVGTQSTPQSVELLEVEAEVGEDVLEVFQIPSGPSPHHSNGVSEATSESDSPGPVDNTDLIVQDHTSTKKLPSLTNEGGRLVQTRLLVERNDFFLLPEVVWKVFTTWYSTISNNYGPALPRTVREDGKIELYPVFFKIFRHTTVPPPSKGSSLPWPMVTFFGSIGLGGLVNSSQSTTPLITGGGAESSPTQPPMPRRVAYYQAAFDKSTTIAEVCEQMRRMLHIKPEDLRIYDFSDEDSPRLLDDETAVIGDLRFSDGQKILVETRNRDNSWPEEMIAIMKEVKARDKEREKPKNQDVRVAPGCTGLSNLGNTCFMNSALQCVSNAQPLTQYFRDKEFLLEINKDNPLGMGGVMAKRYSELMNDLWSGHSKNITPLKFRFTVGRYAPRFNGFQQQDAQELLAFVLDGLHEDLNRVKEKPYLELKDSDGRPDAEVALEAWDYHLSRNQSIIVDLFQGQLKSVVQCKVCGYKSVRFDPFTFLSLPLPMENTVNLEVIVVRLDCSQPVRYGLKVDMDEKYRALKESLSELCGLPIASILLVEVFGALVRNFPSDSTKIRSVLGGWLYAYELPEAPPAVPIARSDSPDEVIRQNRMSELRRERALSLKREDEERELAAQTSDGRSTPPLPAKPKGGEGGEVASQEEKETEGASHEESSRSSPPASSSNVEPSSDVRENEQQQHEEGDHSPPSSPTHPHPSDSAPHKLEDTDEHSNASASPQKEQQPTASPPSSSWGVPDGFVFALHRKLFMVEHYYVSSQKSRPILFSTPMVIPCIPDTPRREVYEEVWRQVERLIIPDPPNSQEEQQDKKEFPFELKLVSKDGFSCPLCPWYKFCRGCPVPCDEDALGEASFIAVDWDVSTLHLKYQQAQERPVDHESMESLKVQDTTPIDLYQCFKAFVRQDQLGEEECWYCKQCKAHQEAVKSLEIWKLPPILIIHLKRFQFFNGRWVKSQQVVTFPIQHLDPMRYAVHNGNGKPVEEAASRHSADPSPSLVEVHESPDSSTHENGDTSDVQRVPNGEPPSIQSARHRAVEGSEMDEERTPGVDEERTPGVDEKRTPEAVGGIAEQESGLDALPSGEQEHNMCYNLFAITCHSGMLGGGHYTSFARNPNGKWYYFNDSSCKETAEERVSQESPYILFFEQEGLSNHYKDFRAKKKGKKQDIGSTEDDREFEETLKNLRSRCCIQ